MATSRRKKISTFGTIAIVLGGTAWAATRAPMFGVGPAVIGTAGLALALLAILGALLIGNTGRIVPLLGLLVCSSAITYAAAHNSTGVGVLDQFKAIIARIRPAPVTAPPAAPPVPSPRPAIPAPVTDDSVGKGTIFDSSDDGKDPSKGTPPAHVNAMPAERSPAIVPPAPTVPMPNATQRYTVAMAAVIRAHASVDAATAGLLPALSQTPAYQAAKSELDDAVTALKAARANNNELGNTELVAAEQRYLNAKSAVQKLINAAAETDPASVAAKQKLISAQSELKVAKEDLAAAGGAGRAGARQ
jgi:hypothetical protein